jgi:hypothetical protein
MLMTDVPQVLAQHAPVAKLRKQGVGSEPRRHALDATLKQTKEMGCFVAGTLVHTKDGLRPIEQIKVGDYVLSKPESGEGELSYQPVTRTYEYEDRELYFLSWSVRKHEEGKAPTWESGDVAVTGAHPIWVRQLSQYPGYGLHTAEQFTDVSTWMSVEELYRRNWRSIWVEEEGMPITVHTELADNRVALIEVIKPILQSPNPDIGVAFDDTDVWHEENCGRTLCFGKGGVQTSDSTPLTYLWNVDKSLYDYSKYDCDSEMSVVKRSGGYLPMRRRVHNLEVADTHTYFVGELGLWVHNTSGIFEEAHFPRATAFG